MIGDCVWDENHSIESGQAKSPIEFILSSIGYHSFGGSFRTITGCYRCLDSIQFSAEGVILRSYQLILVL